MSRGPATKCCPFGVRAAARILHLTLFVFAVAGVLLFARHGFAQPSCPAPLDSSTLPAAVHDSKLVLIGSFVQIENTPNTFDIGHVVIRPESFLKGATSARDVAFSAGFPFLCQQGELRPGDRLLVLAGANDDGPIWPSPERVYRLAEGTAQALVTGAAPGQREDALIADIRGLTNQQSVPAANADEGEGIDWLTTVLPIAGGLAALFIAGLFLMRIWHRIDPS